MASISRNRLVKCMVTGLLMVATSVAAVALAPRDDPDVSGPRLDLESLVPKQFGAWKVDTTVTPVQVSADVKEKLDRIYDQVLSRTYISNSGDRVMLSIAYGGKQTRATQVHKPEICYPAQGFQITKALQATLTTGWGALPIKRLVAVSGSRVEPITYWIMVGETPVAGAIEQNLARIRYAIHGVVPDGMLVRISTIQRDSEQAYEVQESFVRALLDGAGADQRLRLVGRSAG